MKPIDQPADLKTYYQDRRVVSEYIRRRTAQPLNGMLHARQVRFLNQVIARRAPRTVLEVAPGPARLTAELIPVPLGLGADFSPGMLQSARERVRAAGRSWHFLRADAFSLPFADARFDLIFSLRFVRHFTEPERTKLYAELRRILRPGGALVIDAQNRTVRTADHVSRHAVYDELYTREGLDAELRQCGFQLRELHGIINHHGLQRAINRLRTIGLGSAARLLIETLERLPSRQPSTWMVLCERA
jgi:ubiquinone/menaquinone biosynthesis C-methylase UbiE